MDLSEYYFDKGELKQTNQIWSSLLFPIIFIGHFLYEFCVGYWLFGLAGGVRHYPNGRWTELGGIDWAFETPIYAPASYLMASSNTGPCMWGNGGTWGLLLILLASTVVAVATAQLIVRLLNKDNNKFGRFYWRLIVVLLGWLFIPVPVEMTLTYEFTVLC